MFDSEGSKGHLRVCPFLEAWHVLLCGEIFEWAPDGTRGWMERFFWQIDDSDIIFRERDKRIVYAVLRSIAALPRSQVDTWSR